MASPRPRILAIDDHPSNLMVLATALSDEFSFQLATSGPAGLAMAEASPPDLVLLDVMMPDVDGFETCRRFKASPLLAGIPIVFITAVADTVSEIEGLRLGAIDYLHKPVNVDIARQRVLNLLERETLLREVRMHRDHLDELVGQRTAQLLLSNRELTAAKDALEAANRVKQTFLSNMSHELRTPLNVVLGMVDLLNSKLTEPAMLDKTEKIAQAGRRLLNIINDILLLSSLDGGGNDPVLESFGMRSLLGAVEAQFQAQAGRKGLTLRHAIDASVPPRLSGQASRLKQVLCQLVSNAVKFSCRGDIVVDVTVVRRGADGHEIRFAVTDQGEGIDTLQLTELFEAFTQGDASLTRNQGGLGVGLAICKHLTHLMGGHLSIDSATGRGSCFALTVLLHADQGGADADADGTHEIVHAQPDPHRELGIADLSAVQYQLVERLIGLLEMSDVEAVALWNVEREWLCALLRERCVAFKNAMDDYSFDQALAILRPLMPHGRHADVRASS